MQLTNILVPVDFSEPSVHALDYAVSLAAKYDARIHLVHAIALPNLGFPDVDSMWVMKLLPEAERTARAELDKLRSARASLVKFGECRIETDDARNGILHAAERVHADLIVIGTHGRHGLARALLGSIAEAIIRTAPCPVLAVRPPKHAESQPAAEARS